jgi:YidC/Oxa1 family membrane protein insertase
MLPGRILAAAVKTLRNILSANSRKYGQKDSMNFLYLIIIAPIEMLMESIYAFLAVVVRHNHVFYIFGISVSVTLLCLPLYAKAEYIQEKERAIRKKMTGRIASIKKHFKGDEQYMLLSMYYRENHYNPIMALRSSLSLLIQIPFFIAAYHFLSHQDALKGVSFLFIRDLGSPDQLLFIGPRAINILPLLMTLINIVSSSIYTKGFTLQEKAQLYGMAFVFLVLLYNSPSALVIYWTFNNIFSLIKNLVYKLKNPLKILYFAVLVFLAAACIYVIFFRSQSRSRKLYYVSLSVCASLIIAGIPFYIKAFNLIGKKFFPHLRDALISFRGLYIFACITLFVLTGLFIPFNVTASDPAAFSYLSANPSPFAVMVPSVFITLGLFLFWPVYIYFLASKKVKMLLSFGLSLAVIFGIINTFAFSGSYGMLSETLTFPPETNFSLGPALNLLNIFCFVFILFALLFLFKIGSIKILTAIMIIVSLSLLSLVFKKSGEIQNGYMSYSRIVDSGGKGETSEQNIQKEFYLSKTGKNVVLLMLDRAIGSYFPLVLEERNELNTLFDGFTYYPNTLSYFRATNLGCPPVFGGYEYTPERLQERENELMVTKHNESLLVLPGLFKEHDYSVSVFDMPYVNYESAMEVSFFTERGILADTFIGKYSAHLTAELGENAPVNPMRFDVILRRNFVMYGIFSITPPYLRKFIYDKSSYWGTEAKSRFDVVGGSAFDNYAELYYLPEMTGVERGKDTLTILVNDLTHSPSFFQYPDYTVAARITDFGPDKFNGHISSFQHYHANAAVYLLLAKWFDFLKKNEIYDNTRIIIVSDHDEMVKKPLLSESLNKINAYYNPILLVKDFNARGNIQTDTAFMTNADTPLLAVNGLIPNPVNPYTGKELSADKEKGVNIFLGGSNMLRDYTGFASLDKSSSFYHVHDNIFAEENWTKFTKNYNF